MKRKLFDDPVLIIYKSQTRGSKPASEDRSTSPSAASPFFNAPYDRPRASSPSLCTAIAHPLNIHPPSNFATVEPVRRADASGKLYTDQLKTIKKGFKKNQGGLKKQNAPTPGIEAGSDGQIETAETADLAGLLKKASHSVVEGQAGGQT